MAADDVVGGNKLMMKNFSLVTMMLIGSYAFVTVYNNGPRTLFRTAIGAVSHVTTSTWPN